MSIAKTIHTQLYAMDKNLMWCMGSTKFVNTGKGLRFTVNGLIFKGVVDITLDEGRDLYVVSFIKVKKVMNKEIFAQFGIKKYNTVEVVEKTVDGVFFDMLPEILETTVERKVA